MKLQSVILCGGSGTRLWPLSRHQFPKQLLALNDADSMLQATALRVTEGTSWPDIDILQPLVVTNEEYRFISAEQLRQASITPAALILEPFGRNTAPALTVAALRARNDGGDPVLLVMPADHVIGDVERFREAVREGTVHAERGAFVTFGITPRQPHTGYGYIRVATARSGEATALRAFVEKPDLPTAQRYVASGEYLWNSGIFMMKASAWLAEIARARPDIARACEAACARGRSDRDFLRLDREAFAACPSESIDYAVMEGLGSPREGDSARGVVIPLDAGWSDIGAWGALWEVARKDDSGNVARGDTHLVETRDSLVVGGGRLVACIGLSDTVVVDTPDALLVAKRDRMEQVKDVVGWLKANRRPEAESHRKVYRPWGWYDTIDLGPRFQVKRIVVTPGASLSLQMHHHRAEHWVVVTGTAQVTRGEEVFILTENQSTYIPLGVKHRLSNPGKVALEIIEVQSGLYLGEDDIVRYEDTYGRQ
ncbi:MAG TPA: mannose-1-phosphate guanylyltransferase/mannose-6-phosphate isomerase [Burkholderiales bacterium]|nr:mannose-1-phosphate guanylyltransferase/mannose-6-phosphate isomerase [Burkholderiales bacterium]